MVDEIPLFFFQFADHPLVCVMCHSNKKKDLPRARRFYEKWGKFNGVFFLMRCDSLLIF